MRFKSLYNKIVRSHATTEEVAQGFALGIFISLTPTMGFHSVIAISLAALFKKNEISCLIGVWLTNPLTMFPIYFFVYEIGTKIIGSKFTVLRPDSIRDFFSMSGEILMPLWIGGIVCGTIAGIASYYIAYYCYPVLRKQQKKIREKIKHIHPENHEKQ